MLITESILLDFIVISSILMLISVAYIKWCYTHWARAGLKYMEPTFPFGNFWAMGMQKITFGEEIDRCYFLLKSKGLKHAGLYFFHLPIYLSIDLDLIKHIMQVDFAHFVDRGVYHNEKADPLSAHLFSIEGTKWRNLRAKISPTFTSGKMKMMYPLVVQTSKELIGVLDTFNSGDAVEMKDILARLTTDIIGTCAFGLDCNSLRDPETEFRRQGKKFFQNTGKLRLTQFLCFLFPEAMKFFQVRIIPESLSDFFMGVVHETIKYREENNVKRNDFMQLLIQMKDDGTVRDEFNSSKISTDELAAQAFVFFLAGFETSSTTMSFCLYELGQNQEVQEKMRKEINSVLAKHNGEFTYEAMLEMHYMECVINETLRKYPPIPAINRKCVKDYKIPNTDVYLRKGDRIFIPVQAIQHDPEYYPNPEVFDPTRFTEENKKARHQFAFLPFGEGPRVCIGLRFGIMQTKVALTILLKNYKVKLNPRTKVPLVLDTDTILNSAKGGIWMNIEKIHNT